MPESPLQALFQTAQKISTSIQTHLSNLLSQPPHHSRPNQKPLSSPSSSSYATPSYTDATYLQSNDILKKPAAPVTKGSAWKGHLDFSSHPCCSVPRSPNEAAEEGCKRIGRMAILSRMYPCGECADHFKEVLRSNPVEAGSHTDFSQWLCRVHNVVNRSLGKPKFPCERVDARWGKLECEQRACDVLGSLPNFGEEDRR